MGTKIVVCHFLCCLAMAIFCCCAESTTFSPPQEWYFNSGTQQAWFGNNLVWEKYLGKASIEYNKNFTYDTQYRICSNSKLFTAVSMMQLMEAGHFKSIHDPISKYLNANDLEEWGYAEGQKFCPLIYGTTSPCQNITFVSLMSMASGMVAADTCEYSPSEWQYKYCLPNVDVTYYNGSIATFISQFIKIPLQWAPGPTYNLSSTAAAQPKSAKGTYQYNNLNFVILSYFIQKFSGMSLQSYYQKNIFQKVGMSSGTYFDPWFKAFQIQPGQASEYIYYTDTQTSTEPFAFGNCVDIEVNPGQQAGSGGIVSTVPDMVKWYTSLFITKNASLLSESSLEQILYPWSWTGFPFYYSLGTQLTFFPSASFNTPPPVSQKLPAPTSISYMGGSECQFFSIVIWNTTYNLVGGPPCQSLPIVTVAARNNRILNVTKKYWEYVQTQKLNGTFWQLTATPQDGWGATVDDFTDTTTLNLELANYFCTFPASALVPVSVPAPMPPSPAPTNSPVTAAPTECNGLSDANAVKLAGVVAAACLTPTLVIITCLSVWICMIYQQRSTGPSLSLQAEKPQAGIQMGADASL